MAGLCPWPVEIQGEEVDIHGSTDGLRHVCIGTSRAAETMGDDDEGFRVFDTAHHLAVIRNPSGCFLHGDVAGIHHRRWIPSSPSS